MARKKASGGGGPGSGDWLNTYADMVTLLLTFFILLFSMSSLDSAKFNMLVKAFASDSDSSSKIVLAGSTNEDDTQTGKPPMLEESQEDTMEEIYEMLKEFIESQGLSESVEVSNGDDYIFIRFMNDMFFEPNSAVLKQGDRDILQFVGNGIKSIQGQAKMISINGFTAAIPDDPNYAVSDRLLSSDRANAVLMFFEDRIGISSEKLLAVGWGKNQPCAPNDTEENRSKNRRVEILISKENLLAQQLDNVYEKLVE